METDLTDTSRATGCPSCGAALRPGAPWCTLCYADLRPARPEPPATVLLPAAPVAPASTASYGVAASDPLTQPLTAFLPAQAAPVVELPAQPAPPSTATWPCTRCASDNPFTASVCGTCGGAFLAALKDEEKPLLVLPLIGDVGKLSRGQRLGVAAGVIAAIMVPLALITLLLTEKPPPPTPDTGATVTDVQPQ